MVALIFDAAVMGVFIASRLWHPAGCCKVTDNCPSISYLPSYLGCPHLLRAWQLSEGEKLFPLQSDDDSKSVPINSLFVVVGLRNWYYSKPSSLLSESCNLSLLYSDIR